MDSTRALAVAAAAMLLAPVGCKDFERGNFKTAPGYLKSDAVSNFVEGMVLGTPYDSILEGPIAGSHPAIAFSGTEDAPGLLSSSLRVKLIQSDEELMKSLDVSVNVSSTFASLDEKFTFSKTHRLNSQYVYLLVSTRMAGKAQQVAGVTLTDEARKLSPEHFYNRYGDRYAYAAVGGAEIFALVEFRTRASEDKTSLTNSFGFSVWGVSVSTDLKLKMEQASTRAETDVQVLAVGTVPPVLSTKEVTNELTGAKLTVPDISKFLDDVGALIKAFDEKPPAERVASQTLRMHYRSYFGLDGYPGLPSGVESTVAQHREVASDYLLYRSLVDKDFAAYYLDPDYADSPILADLRAHAEDLEAFLARWEADSLHPPPAPTIRATSSIESFATTQAVVDETDLHVYRFSNGFIPKRLTDYDIPSRNATGGKLHGVRVDAFRYMPIRAPEDEAPLQWQLYLVNEPGPQGNRKVLAYRWSNGGAAFFVDGVWDASADRLATPGEIRAALDQLTIAEWTREGELHKQFLLVNTANGLVVQKHATSGPSLYPFTGNDDQRWGFHMPSGSATYEEPGVCDEPLRCPGDPVYIGSWDAVTMQSVISCYCCFRYQWGCLIPCCSYCSAPTTRWLRTSAVVGTAVSADAALPSAEPGCPIEFKGNLVHYLLRTQSTGTRLLHGYCSGNLDSAAKSDTCEPGQGLYPQDDGSGIMVVLGGVDGQVLGDARLYVLPPGSAGGGAWSGLGAIPGEARTGQTGTLLSSGKVLVIGGVTPGGSYDAGAHLLDPIRNAWSEAVPLAQGRVGHTATLLRSGQVLVVGGTRAGVALAETWLFEPPTRSVPLGAWQAGPPLPGGGRSGHSATLLPSGKVLVLGGRDASQAHLGSAEIFDPEFGAWTAASLASLATARADHTATLLSYGNVLVVGGVGSPPAAPAEGASLAVAEIYDPDANASNPVDDLPAGRSRHTATLLPSGKVLVVGGQDAAGDFLGAVRFRPDTAQWEALAEQPLARAGHSATTLSTGLVAIAGGEGGPLGLALDSVELYDASAGTWRAAAPLSPARSGHAAAAVRRPPAGGRPYVNAGVKARSQTCDPAVDCWSAGQRVTAGHDPTGDVPRVRDAPANQQWRIVPIENVEHF